MSHPQLHPAAPGRPSRNVADHARATAVRASMVGDDISTRLLESARRRVRTLHDDGERGSQTAEYAMVGGVGAAAAGALITCIKNKDVLERLMESVLSVLVKSMRQWF